MFIYIKGGLDEDLMINVTRIYMYIYMCAYICIYMCVCIYVYAYATRKHIHNNLRLSLLQHL
jgi:hypothetical protein